MALQERLLSDNQRKIAVPDQKRAGIIDLFTRVLFTEPAESEAIFAKMRGRREGRVVLTFGELLGLADDRKIILAAEKLGIDDVDGPAVDLARIIRLMTHPDIPVCESCNRYAVGTEGGVDSSLYESEGQFRCPHTGCDGLLTPPKQEEPFISWVTLLEVAPGTRQDRKTIPHRPLPIANDAIVQEAGTWYELHGGVTAACESEGLLTDEGTPNVAHLCAYLFHGLAPKRFHAADQALRALGDPGQFGAYDATSMRAVVRTAKQWQPSANVPAPEASRASGPAATATLRLEPGMNPAIAMHLLFKEIFPSTGELRRFLRRHASDIELPGQAAGMAEVSYVAAEGLDRRGYLNAPYGLEFFEALRQAIPRQSANIDAVAKLCGCAPPKKLSGGEVAQVVDLLTSMYMTDEFEHDVVWRIPGGDGLEHQLPGGGSPRGFFNAAVKLLNGKGLITNGFFQALRDTRPAQVVSINRVARSLGI